MATPQPDALGEQKKISVKLAAIKRLQAQIDEVLDKSRDRPGLGVTYSDVFSQCISSIHRSKRTLSESLCVARAQKGNRNQEREATFEEILAYRSETEERQAERKAALVQHAVHSFARSLTRSRDPDAGGNPAAAPSISTEHDPTQHRPSDLLIASPAGRTPKGAHQQHHGTSNPSGSYVSPHPSDSPFATAQGSWEAADMAGPHSGASSRAGTGGPLPTTSTTAPKSPRPTGRPARTSDVTGASTPRTEAAMHDGSQTAREGGHDGSGAAGHDPRSRRWSVSGPVPSPRMQRKRSVADHALTELQKLHDLAEDRLFAPEEQLHLHGPSLTRPPRLSASGQGLALNAGRKSSSPLPSPQPQEGPASASPRPGSIRGAGGRGAHSPPGRPQTSSALPGSTIRGSSSGFGASSPRSGHHAPHATPHSTAAMRQHQQHQPLHSPRAPAASGQALTPSAHHSAPAGPLHIPVNLHHHGEDGGAPTSGSSNAAGAWQPETVSPLSTPHVTARFWRLDTRLRQRLDEHNALAQAAATALRRRANTAPVGATRGGTAPTGGAAMGLDGTSRPGTALLEDGGLPGQQQQQADGLRNHDHPHGEPHSQEGHGPYFENRAPPPHHHHHHHNSTEQPHASSAALERGTSQEYALHARRSHDPALQDHAEEQEGEQEDRHSSPLPLPSSALYADTEGGGDRDHEGRPPIRIHHARGIGDRDRAGQLRPRTTQAAGIPALVPGPGSQDPAKLIKGWRNTPYGVGYHILDRKPSRVAANRPSVNQAAVIQAIRRESLRPMTCPQMRADAAPREDAFPPPPQGSQLD